MSRVPSLSCDRIINALKRDGWYVVRSRGSHIRLQKNAPETTMKLTVPAHRPVKRSTLAQIIKQAHLELDDFLKLL